LRTLVGMVDVRRRMASQGHLQGGDGQVFVQIAAQMPVTQAARVSIQDDRHVDESATELDVGDVAHPDLIRPGDVQLNYQFS